jgi:hypothetical protein
LWYCARIILDPHHREHVDLIRIGLLGFILSGFFRFLGGSLRFQVGLLFLERLLPGFFGFRFLAGLLGGSRIGLFFLLEALQAESVLPQV